MTIVSNYLNYIRCLHMVNQLVPSDNLNYMATKWGQQMMSLKHSNFAYGENIAGAGYIPKKGQNGTDYVLLAIDNWYAENKKYNFSRPGFTAGHFTALVWKFTKSYGVSACYDGVRIVYVVMEFDPPGNAGNAYRYNVFPRVNNTRCNKTI